MEQQPLDMEPECPQRQRSWLRVVVVGSVVAALVAVLVLIVVILLSSDCEEQCRTEASCQEHETCVDQRCEPVCPEDRCGPHAHCRAVRHMPQCACDNGHRGDPLDICKPAPKKDCQKHESCLKNETCIGGKCVDICQDVKCGEKADCIVQDHAPECVCRPLHSGDPYVRCEQEGCVTDDDCGSGEACVNHKCTNVCSGHPCGLNAHCKPRNHSANCFCLPGLVGNPLVQCGPQVCPECWPPKTAADKSFQLHYKEEVDWHTAYSQCRQMNGSLASLKTKDDVKKVKKIIEDTDSTGKLQFWTSGMNVPMDGKSSDHWFWMGVGLPIGNNTEWAGDEANVSGEEYCLEVQHYDAESILWNSKECKDKLNFICEYYKE